MKLFVAFCAALVALAAADDCNVPKKVVYGGDIAGAKWTAPNFQACKDSCRTDDRCHAVVYYNTGIKKGSCFLKDDTHGPRVSAIWAISAFKPCLSKEGPCPANQYKSSPLECANCPKNWYSRPGSTSLKDCHFLRGVYCWDAYNNVRPYSIYSDEMNFDDAKIKCFFSARCKGITCAWNFGKAEKCVLIGRFVYSNSKQQNTMAYRKLC